MKNIFDCIEFKDEKATFSIRELQKASSQGLIDKKVFALGGISLENAKIAKELGLKEYSDYGYINDNCLTELTPENEDGTTTVGIWFKPLDDEVAHMISKKFHLYMG